ncbi:MAG TPA: DUF2520 domain-containing protein [Pyrinomonadaceae bacterium]|jgi:predicted short-subunit dehydrogenase-like oxidoreductase (DUF2520 family)
MRKISIIGVGRVGGALALALSREGYVIENLIVRNPETASKIVGLLAGSPRVVRLEAITGISSDIVFIATQDSEIAGVAESLAGKLKTALPPVLHMSGALSSEALNRLREKGVPTGSLHPLVSLSDARLGAARFAGAFFCVEGEPAAVAAAAKVVAALGGKSFTIATEYKTLYHAAAVTSAGHFVALVDVAVEMLARCGLSAARAQEILLPLIKSTVENLEAQTPAEALTGTFARADVETFEKHLAALDREVSAEAREIYLQLGARSAHLAERQGANAENLKEILAKISLAKKNFRC